MLNIPSEVKTLFQTDGVHKNFHVHFPNGETTDLNNENLLQESVKFTESLCSQEYFKFGLAESSQLEFTAVGIPNILGVVIDCGMEIDCTSLGAAWATAHPVDPTLDFLTPQTCMVGAKLYYRVPYGRFIVDSCPRDHGAMFNRKVTAFSEASFTDKQFMVGQYPISGMKVNPMEWLEAQTLQNSEMTTKTYVKSTAASDKWYPSPVGALVSNGSDDLTSFSGVSCSQPDSYSGLPKPLLTLTGNAINKAYAIRASYKEHEFDSYGKQFYDTAIADLPNKDYSYQITTYQSPWAYVKQFKNTKEMVFAWVGMFQPCYFIVETWQNAGDTKYYYHVSKPVFISPDETFILDIKNRAEAFAFYLSVPSEYTVLRDIKVFVSIPTRWFKSARWTITSRGSQTAISGWSDVAPFGDQTIVERQGSVLVRYAELSDSSIIPRIGINSTLAFTKCSGSGNYYTYSNAISTLGVIEGYVELLGAFWKINRLGAYELFQISENQTPIPILRSGWEEFWWDENTVDSIGKVSVQFSDDSSDQASIATFTLGSGRSIYSMENNDLLKSLIATPSQVQTVLQTYFSANAAVINFTPVELTAKGLPYLEAGDRIELTADDGSTVYTYILEQEISGIQKLTVEITSTNGEVIEVTEQ